MSTVEENNEWALMLGIPPLGIGLYCLIDFSLRPFQARVSEDVLCLRRLFLRPATLFSPSAGGLGVDQALGKFLGCTVIAVYRVTHPNKRSEERRVGEERRSR